MFTILALGLALASQTDAAAQPLAVPATAVAALCPDGHGTDSITVCGRPDGAGGYRLPPPQGFDPSGPIDSVSRERHRMLDVGATGTGSCSPVGPGGWTGCMLIRWREANEQYAGRDHGQERGTSVRVGRLHIAHRD
jgi:hypothetical protein